MSDDQDFGEWAEEQIKWRDARIAELEATLRSHGIMVKTYSGGEPHFCTGNYHELVDLFARALVDMMDGVQAHDIQAETGLPDADCERIQKAREMAEAYLKEKKP